MLSKRKFEANNVILYMDMKSDINILTLTFPGWIVMEKNTSQLSQKRIQLEEGIVQIWGILPDGGIKIWKTSRLLIFQIDSN